MNKNNKSIAGFSLLELLFSMTITLILMAMAGALFSHSIGTRERETNRTEAIIAVQTALKLMSREVVNSGYGLIDNGIVVADSDGNKLRFRSNIHNENATTSDADEDVTFYLDANSRSVVRFDPFGNPKTSTVAERVNDLSFQYFDYTAASSVPTISTTPSANTARVRISVRVLLDPVQGQKENQSVVYTTDVTLRNSKYITKLY